MIKIFSKTKAYIHYSKFSIREKKVESFVLNYITY